MNGFCISNKLKGGFRVVCILTAISLSALWVFRYSQDKDITLVDYKDTDEKVRPIPSLCLRHPILQEKLQDPDLDEPNELSFLAGDLTGKGIRDIDYENTNFNLNNYITRFHVKFLNGTSDKNVSYRSYGDNINIFPTFIGPDLHGNFWKCYGIKVRYGKIAWFIAKIKKTLFKNGTRPSGRDAKNGQQLGVFFHYEHQCYNNPNLGMNMWPEVEKHSSYKMMFGINNFEIIRNRQKKNEPCIADSIDYDEFILNQTAREAGCVFPYFKGIKGYRRCRLGQEIKDAHLLLLKLAMNKKYGHPCTFMQNINYRFIENYSTNNTENEFSFKVTYPAMFKDITKTQAIGVETLIGTTGGYLGLFCGINLPI
jgi:hypothetical protein